MASVVFSVRHRYPFLVLDGPSSVGKTRFAASLTAPFRFVYCDCSNGAYLDLHGLDSESHDAILLDEMGLERAVALKKLLQAGPDICKLGVSPTMVHAYSVYSYRMRISIATNTWAAQFPSCQRWSEAGWF